jgi:predicted neuraminidase
MRGFLFASPPFAQCHGATLAALPDGGLAAAWFAGTREGSPDTAIWMCRRDGDSWSRPRVVAKSGDMAHWNPVLHPLPDGRLMLYYKVGKFPDSWDTYRVKLDQCGVAPRPPHILKSEDWPEGRMTPGPVRGKIVALSSGTLLAPSSIEKVLRKRLVGWSVVMDALWEAVIHRSTDGGRTWRAARVPYPRGEGELGGIIQPSPWEVAPGRAAALFRSTNGRLYRSESLDDGRTWSQAAKTDIPNPNSAVDVATGHGVVALAYNPTAGNWTRRTPLSVAFARADGASFHSRLDVEDDPAGSYSYPAIVATQSGFAMAYTWNRRLIAFREIAVRSALSIGSGDLVVGASASGGPEAYDFGRDAV